jgi:hypothetical protein
MSVSVYVCVKVCVRVRAHKEEGIGKDPSWHMKNTQVVREEKIKNIKSWKSYFSPIKLSDEISIKNQALKFLTKMEKKEMDEHE